MPLKLFDTHAHLTDERFDNDRCFVINDLRQEGINYVLNMGTDLKDSKAGILLANDYSNIYTAVGIHPHVASEVPKDYISQLEKLAKENQKVLVIGEIGLDYHYDLSPRDVQKKVFIEQIELAKSLDLPVSIHSRDATQDTIDILKEHSNGLKPSIIHCFSGSVETAKIYLDLGFYISFAGPVTFKNASKLQEVAKYIPAKNMLIETDSPYLAPTPMRGLRNEPKYVGYIADTICNLKQIDFDEFCDIVYKNSFDVLCIKED